MKLYAVKHQPTGKWVVSTELSLDEPDVRCFRTARSARSFIRSIRNKGWWSVRCDMDPNELIMVEVDAVIDFNSVKRVRLPEESG